MVGDRMVGCWKGGYKLGIRKITIIDTSSELVENNLTLV